MYNEAVTVPQNSFVRCSVVKLVSNVYFVIA